MQSAFDIAADLNTPVSAYLKLAPFKPRFLLESVEGGDRLGRYSFIGFGDSVEFRLFEGLPNPFNAGRYHSLAVTEQELPEALVVSAYTSDGEIMGIRHRTFPTEGVQFHPESVLTAQGDRLLCNFLDLEGPERWS